MKFSIRDLLWLTVLAAVLAAWWVDHCRLVGAPTVYDWWRPRLVPAEGIVTFRGQPLDDACLTVGYPDGEIAVAHTNLDGSFTLTFLGFAGARPGQKLPVIIEDASAGPNSRLSPQLADFRTSNLTLDIPAAGSKRLRIETFVPPRP